MMLTLTFPAAITQGAAHAQAQLPPRLPERLHRAAALGETGQVCLAEDGGHG
jgi:hypothetical protein